MKKREIQKMRRIAEEQSYSIKSSLKKDATRMCNNLRFFQRLKIALKIIFKMI